MLEYFNLMKKTECDICQHLETLKNYAVECDHITELGMRWGTSTVALAAGIPVKLVSYDINRDNNAIKRVSDFAIENNFEFKFIQANVLNIDIEETDLLFIDTYHTGTQLNLELKKHANKAKKYIIFHDTETFGKIGEDNVYPGLVPVIEEFLSNNKQWKLKEIFKNNNGLTIIERN